LIGSLELPLRCAPVSLAFGILCGNPVPSSSSRARTTGASFSTPSMSSCRTPAKSSPRIPFSSGSHRPARARGHPRAGKLKSNQIKSNRVYAFGGGLVPGCLESEHTERTPLYRPLLWLRSEHTFWCARARVCSRDS
jgi:hypothetical protein